MQESVGIGNFRQDYEPYLSLMVQNTDHKHMLWIGLVGREKLVKYRDGLGGLFTVHKRNKSQKGVRIVESWLIKNWFLNHGLRTNRISYSPIYEI